MFASNALQKKTVGTIVEIKQFDDIELRNEKFSYLWFAESEHGVECNRRNAITK